MQVTVKYSPLIVLTVATLCAVERGVAAVPSTPTVARPLGFISRCGQLKLRPGMPDPEAAISPNGELVATIGAFSTHVGLWAVESGEKVGALNVNERMQSPLVLRFAPDGDTIAVAGVVGIMDRRAVLRIVDLRGKKRLRLEMPVEGSPWPYGVVLAFSPDGRFLAYCSQDGTIQIVNVNDGTTSKELKYVRKGTATTIRWSKDGRQIAAAGPQWVRSWDVSSGKLSVSADSVNVRPILGELLRKVVTPFPAPRQPPLQVRWTWNNRSAEQTHYHVEEWEPRGAIRCVLLSPELSTVAFWSDTHVWVRDLSTGRVLKEFERGGKVFFSDVAYSHDGKALAFETCNDGIRLVDLATGKVNAEFRGHRSKARDIAFSRDGSRLLATTEVRVYAWDVKTRKLLPYLDGHEAVTSVTFSPDGRLVASTGVLPANNKRELPKVLPATSDGVRVWDVRTGQERLNLSSSRSDGVLFSETENTILTWRSNGQLTVRDLTGKTIRRVKLDVWDGKSPRALINPLTGQVIPLASHISFIDIADDGTLVYLIAARQLAFYDQQKDTSRFLPPANDNDVDPRLLALSISRHPFRLLGIENTDSTGDFDYFAVIIDAKKGMRNVVYDPKEYDVMAVRFSSDAKLFAAWCESHRDIESAEIHIVEAATGQLRKSVRIAPCHLELNPFSFHRLPFALSPNGKLLATGDDKGSLHLWDVKSGKKVHEFTGHRGPVTCLAFSKNGHRLASGSLDSTVVVWDVRALME